MEGISAKTRRMTKRRPRKPTCFTLTPPVRGAQESSFVSNILASHTTNHPARRAR
jgi:hypothetical protein